MHQNLFEIKFVYHLHHLFGINYKTLLYSLKITLNYWFISKIINIKGNFIWECPLGPCCFSFFSVISTFKVTCCIFALICFNCSNSLVPVSFLLHHYIGQYNQMEILMWRIATIKQPFWTIMLLHWSLNSFNFIFALFFWNLIQSYHTIASYYTFFFLLS